MKKGEGSIFLGGIFYDTRHIKNEQSSKFY